MTEGELQSAVIELARVLGWRVAHFRPAWTSRGYRTAGEGDAAGFPDLVLARRPRVLFVELKAPKGKPTDEQVDWLAELGAGPVEVYLWRPEDWLAGTIERSLRFA